MLISAVFASRVDQRDDCSNRRTSDYGPEMLHAPLKHRIRLLCPSGYLSAFMVMPDAIKSLLLLESAPRETSTTDLQVTVFARGAGYL